VDGGIFVLMGNDEYLLRQIAAGERERARDYAAWLLGSAGGYAIKIVNPGGIEAWKSGQRNLNGLDEPLAGRGVTGRAILEALANAGHELGLPHPVHIHCNNLGMPGNAEVTLASMQALTAGEPTSPTCSFTATGDRGGSLEPRS
jgi:formylmethanofuran dehydrogenase subunit A